MSHSYTLSLRSAIVININIMFGTGLFINTIMLAKQTGFLGFLSYALVALLIAPLIICFGYLLQLHPAGGFYTYGAREISPLAGFVSAWSYFIGKLASAALLIHVFSSLVSALLAPSFALNPFLLDGAILALFAWFNLYNFKTSRIVMYSFLTLKIIPIFFVIFSCLFLMNLWSIPTNTLLWSGIPSTIPLVLYAFTGFEACCSLSALLTNPAQDGPRAIAFSYLAVVSITIMYQFLFFLTLGPILMKQDSSLLGVFPPLLHTLWASYPTLAHYAIAFFHSAIATASLGGSYGILFSNHWNFYALAERGHLPASWLFTWVNKFHIPVAGVIIEVLLCMSYLMLLNGNITLLQQMSVFGCTIAFAISMIALLKALYLRPSSHHQRIIAWLSIGSCALFFALSIRSFILSGIGSLYLFFVLFFLGLWMFWKTKPTCE